jgi:hypothetical protein
MGEYMLRPLPARLSSGWWPSRASWRDSGDIRLSPTLARLEVHCFPGAKWSRNLARRLDERAPA